MDSLTNEQRELVTSAARNANATRALIQFTREMGLAGDEALAALATAITVIIEANLPAAERLSAMNALLAPTITEWAGSSPAGVVIQ